MSENTNTYPSAALRMAHQNGVSEGRVEMAADVRPILGALHSICGALFADPDDPQLMAMKNAAELLDKLPSDAVFGDVPAPPMPDPSALETAARELLWAIAVHPAGWVFKSETEALRAALDAEPVTRADASIAAIRQITTDIKAGVLTDFPDELREVARRIVAQPARPMSEEEARQWADGLLDAEKAAHSEDNCNWFNVVARHVDRATFDKILALVGWYDEPSQVDAEPVFDFQASATASMAGAKELLEADGENVAELCAAAGASLDRQWELDAEPVGETYTQQPDETDAEFGRRTASRARRNEPVGEVANPLERARELFTGFGEPVGEVTTTGSLGKAEKLVSPAMPIDGKRAHRLIWDVAKAIDAAHAAGAAAAMGKVLVIVEKAIDVAQETQERYAQDGAHGAAVSFGAEAAVLRDLLAKLPTDGGT